jgi:succinate dehydrogenase/fumarate reductase flavoprotein subunit
MDSYDVIVLGTGAAGMAAAVRAASSGATVGLFERDTKVGGTTAWSGGMVWIPNHPHMPEIGAQDSREQALTYLRSLSHGMLIDELIEALVDHGPQMIGWFEDNTCVRFQAVPGWPDYYPEHPGGLQEGGRALECPLFPFEDLGEWADRVTRGYQISGQTMMSESSMARNRPEGGVTAAELERRALRDERGAGQALAGSLLRACLDAGVAPITECRAVALLTDDNAVTGVRFERTDASMFEARARGGVVLATGGFEWDEALKQAFLRGPLTRTAAVPTNTGDGLRMAMRLGVALGNMREAWWVPMIDVDVPGWGTVHWQVNGERSRPHCIMVNDAGHRFTDEAANYNAFGSAFHVVDVARFEYVNHPAWMVFDSHYLTTYGLANHRDPDHTPAWMTSAPTLAELAGKIGIPADALRDTVARWNANVADGHDPDFSRGVSAHDRFWGDAKFGMTPQTTLGPVDTPPFHAVRVHSGCLGTKGGPRTDGTGRVLDVDGNVIPGLYAAGNVMCSPMGMTYGGHGGTLGPALTFGWLGGADAAQRAAAPGRNSRTSGTGQLEPAGPR